MSYVTVAGNIAGDLDLRFTASGKAVVAFTLAENQRKKNAAGEWEDGEPNWWRVVCWQDMAENVTSSLEKGHRVVVTGRVEIRDWEDNEGNKRRSVEIIADEVGASLRWATATIEKVKRSSGHEDRPITEEEPF